MLRRGSKRQSIRWLSCNEEVLRIGGFDGSSLALQKRGVRGFVTTAGIDLLGTLDGDNCTVPQACYFIYEHLSIPAIGIGTCQYRTC